MHFYFWIVPISLYRINQARVHFVFVFFYMEYTLFMQRQTVEKSKFVPFLLHPRQSKSYKGSDQIGIISKIDLWSTFVAGQRSMHQLKIPSVVNNYRSCQIQNKNRIVPADAIRGE